MSSVPPQAFTKQDIARAIQWLHTQPKHIQDLAKDKESLMRIFRQANRFGEDSLGHEPETETFRNELKDLAKQLGSFSEEKKDKPPISPLSQDENEISWSSEPAQRKLEFKEELDSVSEEKILKIQKRFHLSSKMEALRLCIALASEKLEKL